MIDIKCGSTCNLGNCFQSTTNAVSVNFVKSSSSSGFPLGAIIGIAVGGAVFLLLILLAIVIIIKRKSSSGFTKSNDIVMTTTQDRSTVHQTSTSVSQDRFSDRSSVAHERSSVNPDDHGRASGRHASSTVSKKLKDWQIDYREIDIITELGQGNSYFHTIEIFKFKRIFWYSLESKMEKC